MEAMMTDKTPSSELPLEKLPEWIQKRVRLLGHDPQWVHKPIPALDHRSVSRAFETGEFELIMRVFSRNADFLGKENPFLYNFTDDERATYGIAK
jgi:hypothetical protein